jgi:hypothetical protein
MVLVVLGLIGLLLGYDATYIVAAQAVFYAIRTFSRPRTVENAILIIHHDLMYKGDIIRPHRCIS